MFHGWRFDPDGDQTAADSTRSSTSFGTGRSVNPRTARRLKTASYTSTISHLLLAYAPQRLGRGPAPKTANLATRCNILRIGANAQTTEQRCLRHRRLVEGTF